MGHLCCTSFKIQNDIAKEPIDTSGAFKKNPKARRSHMAVVLTKCAKCHSHSEPHYDGE